MWKSPSLPMTSSTKEARGPRTRVGGLKKENTGNDGLVHRRKAVCRSCCSHDFIQSLLVWKIGMLYNGNRCEALRNGGIMDDRDERDQKDPENSLNHTGETKET